MVVGHGVPPSYQPGLTNSNRGEKLKIVFISYPRQPNLKYLTTRQQKNPAQVSLSGYSCTAHGSWYLLSPLAERYSQSSIVGGVSIGLHSAANVQY